MQGGERENADSGSAPPADPGQARLSLTAFGLPDDLARYLTSTPEKAYWAAQWVLWFPCISHRIRKPRGFLAQRIEAAAAGVAEARLPPGEYYDRLEAAAKRTQSRERTASKVAAGVGTPAAAGDTEALWRNFLRLVHRDSSSVCALVKTYTRSVVREGDTLVVTVPADRLPQFEREREFLARLARKANPACPELRIVTPKGGR